MYQYKAIIYMMFSSLKPLYSSGIRLRGDTAFTGSAEARLGSARQAGSAFRNQ